jgi:hypothetical protein
MLQNSRLADGYHSQTLTSNNLLYALFPHDA